MKGSQIAYNFNILSEYISLYSAEIKAQIWHYPLIATYSIRRVFCPLKKMKDRDNIVTGHLPLLFSKFQRFAARGATHFFAIIAIRMPRMINQMSMCQSSTSLIGILFHVKPCLKTVGLINGGLGRKGQSRLRECTWGCCKDPDFWCHWFCLWWHITISNLSTNPGHFLWVLPGQNSVVVFQK